MPLDVCPPTAYEGAGDAELLPTWRPSLRSCCENHSTSLFPQCSGRTSLHSKSIAVRFQTASFKSLYRKRSGGKDERKPPASCRRSVSDTALRLSVNWTGAGEHEGVRKADSGSRSDPGTGFGRIDRWRVSGRAVIPEERLSRPHRNHQGGGVLRSDPAIRMRRAGIEVNGVAFA